MLPSVMRSKKEKMVAEAAPTEPQNNVVVLSSAIPNDTPQPVAAVEEAPIETPPVEEEPLTLEKQWEIKFKTTDQKYQSLKGVVAQLEPELRSEKSAREKLEKDLAELRESIKSIPKPPPVADPEEELSPEELEVYKDSQAVIQKVARKVARGEIKAALQMVEDLRNDIKELREGGSRIEERANATEEQQFINYVKSSIPNFEKITAMNEWADHLEQKAPYSRKTYKQLLGEAHAARDFDTISEIFAGFKPSKATLATMVSPPMRGGAAPISTNGQQKPRLKWSDRQKISNDFIKGRVKPEDKAKWDALFKEAEAEGRVDYDK